MPIKFIGWLREFCGEVEITKHKEALPPNVIDADKYRTVYIHLSTKAQAFSNMRIR